MSLRAGLVVLAAAMAAGGGGGCYQDDATFPPSLSVARVLLTDAPFPYDSVQSVNVHVVRVEASPTWTGPDSGDWTLIAEPRQTFNLLSLQRGTTAFLGEEELPAGQYQMVRLTIDTSLSSIEWLGGAEREVRWQNGSGSSEMPLYANVEAPVNVPAHGAEIVIDFDVGRSFIYNFYGTREFTFIPYLRAINSAATGALAGIVTSDASGDTLPFPNASVSILLDGACAPPICTVVATGRSDDTGYYKVAFVPAGTYAIRIEALSPGLEPIVTSNVTITGGETTELSVTLHEPGSGSGFITISGPSVVGIGRTVALVATARDANGDPVPPSTITWESTGGLATVVGVGDTGYVTGNQAGGNWIVATAQVGTDMHWMNVVASTAPVASVTVVPAADTVTVGQDSVFFTAEVRDTAGILLMDRFVSWFATDTTVIAVQASGQHALVRVLGPGNAMLRATTEGKVGQATITARP